MEEIMISVVVPVYNVSNYIDRCIESITNQTYRNLEILLIDDGSQDESGKKCDEWGKKDSRIVVYHKQNEGLGLTRNYGIERANGDFVTFVDSDDYIAVDMFEKMETARKKVNADTVIVGYQQVSDNKVIYTQRYTYEVYTGKSVMMKLLPRFIGSMPECQDGLFQTAWGKLYSRKLLLDYKLCFVSEREYQSEDMVFQLDYFKYSLCTAILEETPYKYYINKESLTHRYKSERFEENEKIYRYVKNKMDEYKLGEKEYLRLGKLFLVQICGSLQQEVIYEKENSLKTCFRNMKQILNKDIVEEALVDYPIRELTWKQRCFAYMIKRRTVFILYISFKLMKLMKAL